MIEFKILYIVTDKKYRKYYLKTVDLNDFHIVSEFHIDDFSTSQMLVDVKTILLSKMEYYEDIEVDQMEELYSKDFNVDKVVHVSKQVEETV